MFDILFDEEMDKDKKEKVCILVYSKLKEVQSFACYLGI